MAEHVVTRAASAMILVIGVLAPAAAIGQEPIIDEAEKKAIAEDGAICKEQESTFMKRLNCELDRSQARRDRGEVRGVNYCNKHYLEQGDRSLMETWLEVNALHEQARSSSSGIPMKAGKISQETLNDELNCITDELHERRAFPYTTYRDTPSGTNMLVPTDREQAIRDFLSGKAE